MKSKKTLTAIIGLFLTAIILIIVFTYLEIEGSKVSDSLQSEKQVAIASPSYHLKDNPVIYNNQDMTSVQTMYLTVSRGNDSENTNHSWDEVNNYSAYDYVEMNVERYQVAALLQVGDENGPQAGKLGYSDRVPNATVQIRGQSSSKNAQKNYKIEVKDNKGDWQGQTTINLNKHQSDSLRFRNKLAFTLLQDIPQLLSLRTQFVHLYVKDTTGSNPDEFVDYGLYTQVEQLNKTGMKAHNLDSNGQLYKVNFFEFMDPDNVIKLATDPDYDLKAFEKMLEIKGSNDHTKLIDLMDKVNDASLDFKTVLDKHFDTQNLAYWMAFQILMGNRDTQSRNMFLYSPTNSERWYIIPWDHDASLFETEYSFDKVVGNVDWEIGISNYWGNMLFQRALKTESFLEELDAAIEDLRANYLTSDRITDLSTQLSQTVAPYISKTPDSTYLGISTADYQTILNALPKEVEQNYKTYKENLEKPMPFFINTPEKKENKLELSWGVAFDFDAEDITYTVEVSKNHDFSTTIYKKDNISLTSAEMDLPSQTGQYFIRVKATNKSGKSQYAFDYYVADNSKHVGTKAFYIDESGEISEETYVEN